MNCGFTKGQIGRCYCKKCDANPLVFWNSRTKKFKHVCSDGETIYFSSVEVVEDDDDMQRDDNLSFCE